MAHLWNVSDYNRPWGWFTGIACKWFWIKLIYVRPDHYTSSQYHANRAEFHMLVWPPIPWEWRLVRRYKVHRLVHGLYVELAWGRPSESDIVRLRDRYGRCNG